METNFPSELIDLPSKGKLYPEGSVLRSGSIKLKYPTSRSEDILTNQEYIQKGTVVDKFLQDLIVNPEVNYGELLTGDKNALLVAARILGYGKDYSFDYKGETVTVDLSLIQDKPLHPVVEAATENKFTFTLPVSGRVLEFKLMTHDDDQAVDRELKGLRKMTKGLVPEMTTRLKYMILSVDGDEDRKNIRAFVDGELLAADSRAFRKYVTNIQPDIDMTFYSESEDKVVSIPIEPSFLWPDIE